MTPPLDIAQRSWWLPAKFIHDRSDRDLPCGEVEFKGRIAIVTCDCKVLADIKDDAEVQGWFTAYEDRSLINSARRTFQILEEGCAS